MLRSIEEAELQPFPTTYTARIPSRSVYNTNYYLEYRTNAHWDSPTGNANQPGVYLSVLQGDEPFVLQLTSSADNYSGITPLAIGSWIQIEPGLRVLLTSVADTATGYIEFDVQSAQIPCDEDWSVCPTEYACDGRMCEFVGTDDGRDGRR